MIRGLSLKHRLKLQSFHLDRELFIGLLGRFLRAEGRIDFVFSAWVFWFIIVEYKQFGHSLADKGATGSGSGRGVVGWRCLVVTTELP